MDKTKDAAKIPKIVNKYRGDKSLRDFASDLTKDLPGESITHQSIKYWIDGTFYPNRYFLVRLILKCRDWRMDFASEILAALYPDIYGETIEKLPVLERMKLSRKVTK